MQYLKSLASERQILSATGEAKRLSRVTTTNEIKKGGYAGGSRTQSHLNLCVALSIFRTQTDAAGKWSN